MIVIYGTLMSIIKKKNIWSYFFHFFQNFGSLGGVKGQKMVQNEKEFCLSCSISPESNII